MGTEQKKLVYLIGDPVEHSVSPQMHNAAYSALDLDFEYRLLKVAPSDLGKTIERLRAEEVAGFNVTVPHKENVIKYLDSVNESALIIGAVNSVKNENGKLKGYNTDSIGFTESIIKDGRIALKNKKVVMIGAGGAAKAVAVALCKEEIAELTLTDINTEKAKNLAESLKKNFNNRISDVSDNNALKQFIINCDCIINTTPIGMYPNVGASPLDENSPIHEGHFIYDLVYNPAVTALVKIARKKGAKAMTGLGMLVRQGAAAFELFTEKNAPIQIMWDAAEKALGLYKH